LRAPPHVPAPVVPIAATLILGAAWGGPRPSPELAAIVAIASAISAVIVKRHARIVVVCAAIAALAAGAAMQGFAWREASARLGAVFGDTAFREMEVSGRVLAAPERARDGGRSLGIASRQDGTTPTLRIRLEIANVPQDDAARIDNLRRGDIVRVWSRLRPPSPDPD
jgi:hypothetical protein